MNAPTPATVTTTPRPSTRSAPEGPLGEFDRVLAEASRNRQQQLADLPDDVTDHVVLAQRESLSEVLEDIARARQRISDGTFGTCPGCGRSIPTERLEIRPWSATCIGCARR
ncbi:TraR/DksA family transcriptional regulator [Nocardioides bigeumensis]|uniref:Zinc finger DksA/TraR C4-type domain-containing protein n=1 Tax=Nocardioides bigeumensis TaxID=433657 RepID=A0ABP5KCJ1_9ACTN